MSALDTSVVVPALASWHEAHDRTRRAAFGASIPEHALLESYAVLTRLPPPHRVDPSTAAELLQRWFPPNRVLAPRRGTTSAAALLRQLVDAGVDGGASYDGLVGLTAVAHGEMLLTRDARATPTYERLGIPYELLV